MRIATWNVNSIRQRLEIAVAWLKERQPDLVCLQEIKCVDEAFPREPFEALGYNVATHGQKGFNGVALLSRMPFDETTPRLAGDDSDVQARFIEGVVAGKNGAVRVGCLYLPNGNPINTDKFPYKISWMNRLIQYARERLKFEESFVLAGDFNVIPTAADARFPEAWTKDALFQPQTRERFQSLVNLGFTDAIRATSDDAGLYTF
jgi:exodeoxyribonuclease-3